MCWSHDKWDEMMRGAKQRKISSGRGQKAPGHGVETGLVKRGPGRPRKDATPASQGSAAGEQEEEEEHGGVQEGHLLRPSPSDNILSFRCSACGKFYRTKASLSSHKYICKRKNRQLTLGSKLKRKFPCTVCGKHYGSKQYLKIHLKHSHSETKEPQNKRTISKGDVKDDSDTKWKKTDSRAATARVIKVIIPFIFSLWTNDLWTNDSGA